MADHDVLRYRGQLPITRTASQLGRRPSITQQLNSSINRYGNMMPIT